MNMISVARLKAHLSACLRTVKAGRELWVTDRGRPVARIMPMADLEASRRELVRGGLIRPAARKLPGSFWRGLPRKDLKAAGVLKALLSERDAAR